VVKTDHVELGIERKRPGADTGTVVRHSGRRSSLTRAWRVANAAELLGRGHCRRTTGSKTAGPDDKATPWSVADYRLPVLLYCGGIKWQAHDVTTM